MSKKANAVLKQTPTKQSMFKTLLKLFTLRPQLLLVLFLSALTASVTGIFTTTIPMLLINFRDYPFSVTEMLAGLVLIRLVLEGISLSLSRLIDSNIQIFSQQVKIEFAKKTMNLPYEDLEDPDILNIKEQASYAVIYYPAVVQFMNNLSVAISALMSLFAIAGVLFSFSWKLVTLIAFISSWGVYISSVQYKKLNESLKQNTQVNRMYGYFMAKAFNPELQKEARLYRLNRLIVGRLRDINHKLAAWMQELSIQEGRAESALSILSYVVTFIALTYSGLRFSTNQFGPQIDIGAFTFYVGLSRQFSHVLLDATTNIVNAKNNLNILEPFVDYMQLDESGKRSGHRAVPALESLEFKNVSFSYPKSDKLILNNVSFQIKQGEHISIVGANGAGKTTIVKLICRLFEPDSGQILWNGIPITDLNYTEYVKALSTVFQDYKLMPFSLRGNLDPTNRYSDHEIEDALAKVELLETIGATEHGLDSTLDSSLDEKGVAFSGGQNQKIAIARALLKDAELLILDEPTAALDPLAETKIYENFASITEGKMAIIISHRMSSSIFCDKILVLEEGRVVALAPHTDLLAQDTIYKELFETQAKYYLNK